MIGIYKITSPSGRIYIGQSRDINKRKNYYSKLDCKNQIRLYNSLLKYGWINHLFEIIEECDFANLNVRERYWQEYYNCIKEGLNCFYTETDILPKVFSEETRKKMSVSGKSRNNSYMTSEYIMKRSGENHWSFGKKFSEEHKQNLITSFTGNRMGLENHKTNIILDMQTGIFYIGFQEVADVYGVHRKTASKWLTGKQPNKTYLQIV